MAQLQMAGTARRFTRPVQFGLIDNPSAILMGGGKTTLGAIDVTGSPHLPLTTSLADKTFIRFETENTALSGDNRCMYLRNYISGAGQTSDCLRVYQIVNDVAAAGAFGAHISLGFATSGYVTGLGVGCRATLMIPNSILAGGTIAALQAEAYMGGNSSSVASTEHALIRALVDGGDATAKATFKNFLSLSASDGSGNMIYTHSVTGTTGTGSIRIRVGGLTKYIYFYDSQ